MADKNLHHLINKLNPHLKFTSNREFFEISPDDAYEILSSMAAIHGREDKLVKYPPKNKLDQISTLSKKEGSVTNNTYDISESVEEIRVYLISKKHSIDAKGIFYPKEGNLKVLKGSKIKEFNSKSCPENVVNLSNQLEVDGVIKNNVFEDDYIFPSPSLAAAMVKRNSANGWVEWKSEDGEPLDFIRKKN